MSPSAILLGILAPAAAAIAVPQPGAIQTFRDWTVGCDNIGHCQAVSLVPDLAGAYDRWEGPITLVRSADQDGALKVRVLIEAPDIDRYQMLVDGKLVDTGPISKGDYQIEIVGQDAKKVANAIALGSELQVVGPNNENLTRVSLAGSAAALRYIDAQQKRAGTRTALVAKGRRQFRSKTVNLPLVLVDQWDRSELIPDTGQIVALAESSSCKEDRFGLVEDQAFPMGKRGDQKLSLVLISCGSGAYNFSSIAYIGRLGTNEIGPKTWEFKPAKFDVPPGWGSFDTSSLLVNASFDPEDQTLASHAKGRGIGDGGNAEEYDWDGEMFRLITASAMSECRGGYEWITTWRAKYQKIKQ